ncbi:MAG: pitrilysin family protein [Bryobacteraceae bacterium]
MTRVLGFPTLLFLFAASVWGQIKLPPYSRRVLPNGVTLLVVKRAGVPLVNIDVAVKGGKESEPQALPGISSVTADLLRKGTTSYSADQFSNSLDALGGSYRVRADEQMTLLESEFLAKDFSRGLSLVADAILHPTFPNDEVVKLLGQRRDDIKALKDNPSEAISPYAHAFFFGVTHPYGRIIDEESVSRITGSDIEQYYRRLYNAHNFIVAVAGDVDPAAVSREAEQAFARAPSGEPYRWNPPIELSRPAADRLMLIDKPGATQSYFYIVQPGIAAGNPDRVAIRVVNTLFGGRFTSMLNEELRVKTGLSYGARNAIETDRLEGMNAIETFTKTDSTGHALEIAISTLKALRNQGITADQLASAKAYLKGTIPRETLETGDQLARQLIRLEVLGYNRDEIDSLFERIDAVTLSQANVVAKNYFRTSGLTFVLIGDAAKIRSQLVKFSPHLQEASIAKPGFGTVSN